MHRVRYLSAAILLFEFVMLTPAISEAQLVGIGVKGGVTQASLGGENSQNQARTGLHIGVFAPVKLVADFHVQFGLLFSQQGTRIEDDLVLRYNYLMLPVVLQEHLGAFYLEGGAQIGRLQSAVLVESSGAASIRSQITSVDGSLIAGVGYLLDKYSIVMSFRYTHGLTNTLKNDMNDLKFTNETFQLSVGYIFS